MSSHSREWQKRSVQRIALVCCSAVLVLAACGSLPRHAAPPDRPPPALEGFSHIRYYPLDPSTPPQPPESVDAAYAGEPADSYEVQPDGSIAYSYLAVSGGGSDGAFGAGLMKGWTEHGDRPKFKMVTGVSTGNLIAPFAFLGPGYDDALKDAYTTINASHIFEMRGLLSLFWEESLTDNTPFKNMIAKHVDQAFLDAIAAEHRKGRRLYVLTTDLDRMQPVIWDMGAIANSQSPKRLELFRQVMLASASIPVFFPPVMLQVEIDGAARDEMHVDGSVFAQSFFIGNQVDLREVVHRTHPEWTKPSTHRLYVIRNGRLASQPSVADRSLKSIGVRSLDAMLAVSGINDLYRHYVGDVNGELELHYIAIPADYVPASPDEFDQKEMIQEYDLGYRMAADGIPWGHTPPGYLVGSGTLAQ